ILNLRVTTPADFTGSFISAQPRDFMMGNKYYFSVEYKVAKNGMFRPYINGSYVFIDVEPVVGAFHQRSVIFESSTSGTSITFRHDTSDYEVGEVWSIRKPILIDLTEAFGKGNEPTAEQMDELLEQFPNKWFDGTKNLFNAKHMMNTYHKKITQLENAITALGGGS